MRLLTFSFWFSVVVIFYAYFGYPLLMWVLAAVRPKPVQIDENARPSLTLLIAAYNEAEVIREKIENSLALDYPKERLEIAVVADGSDDATPAIAREYAGRGVTTHFQPERKGKMAAINRAFPLCRGEVVVFSDANNLYRPDALLKLVRNFADERVGAATGRKVLRRTQSEVGESENLYWRYESFIRLKESQFSFTTGAVGEILAVRKGLYVAPPPYVINDDFYIAMAVIRQNARVVYEPEAISEEMPSASMNAEMVRRSRISAGLLQSLLMLPQLLKGAPALAYFQAVSHKLLRPLVPVLMLVALAVNICLVLKRPRLDVYAAAAVAQAVFYLLTAGGAALTRLGMKIKLFYVPYYFCVSNFAYLVGLYRLASGKQTVLWTKARREP
jgi:cellulose synthase/poly-beta-1,6-N-acetylglucosamine synthase-like glycosyltransferase